MSHPQLWIEASGSDASVRKLDDSVAASWISFPIQPNSSTSIDEVDIANSTFVLCIMFIARCCAWNEETTRVDFVSSLTAPPTAFIHSSRCSYRYSWCFLSSIQVCTRHSGTPCICVWTQRVESIHSTSFTILVLRMIGWLVGWLAGCFINGTRCIMDILRQTKNQWKVFKRWFIKNKTIKRNWMGFLIQS